MFPLLGFEPGELVAVRQCHQTCCRRCSVADRQPAMAVPTGLLRVSDDEAPVHVNTVTIESQPHLPTDRARGRTLLLKGEGEAVGRGSRMGCWTQGKDTLLLKFYSQTGSYDY